MKLDSIGKNIKKYRLSKNLRQEDLAELAELSANYIGSLERGEKTPSLPTFIEILNALEASADIVFSDVLNSGYIVKDSLLHEQLAQLSPEERKRVYNIIETFLKTS